MIDLKQAIKNRDRFLDENPHLKGYQRDIDAVLNKTPQEYRLDALMIMVAKNMQLLGKAITALQKQMDTYQ